MKLAIRWILALALLQLPTLAHAWKAELITSGLHVPWGVSDIGEDRVIISEKNGRIGILNLANKHYTPIASHPNVTISGQGGLLDIARSPFDSQTIYFTYAKQVRDAIETTLSRAKLDDNKLSQWQDLVVTRSGSDGGRHFGSRVTFDDTSIFFSVGDRGERSNGQDLSTHAGAILRINLDGTALSDNPFIDKKGALAEIWSYGHRNPQGLFYDRLTSNLWSIEHGPRGGDEINLIIKGENYGWPITSHGKEYWGPISVGEAQEKDGIRSPKHVYIPSIAPSSLLLYRGSTYPQLNGKLVAGALKGAHINIITLDAQNNAVKEERILEDFGERIRDIETTSNGSIIFSTDQGNIYKLIRPN
ncbi:PQQ-dependent sugar dehydrogenase [Vibrio atypicus]|uniref:PQQ-dependent sugar dehydrogenase n=1 Tax=Vibrio atypicus TaxID=558271 RepID=UPI00135759B3|nr:PQQ-dependent sugar dehydrogenase [Vibrio atypicus]